MSNEIKFFTTPPGNLNNRSDLFRGTHVLSGRNETDQAPPGLSTAGSGVNLFRLISKHTFPIDGYAGLWDGLGIRPVATQSSTKLPIQGGMAWDSELNNLKQIAGVRQTFYDRLSRSQSEDVDVPKGEVPVLGALLYAQGLAESAQAAVDQTTLSHRQDLKPSMEAFAKAMNSPNGTIFDCCSSCRLLEISKCTGLKVEAVSFTPSLGSHSVSGHTFNMQVTGMATLSDSDCQVSKAFTRAYGSANKGDDALADLGKAAKEHPELAFAPCVTNHGIAITPNEFGSIFTLD